MAQRFELIKPYLDKYKRRFTVLDLGAGWAYESREIAKNYDAVVTIVDKGLNTETYPMNYEGLPRWIALKREFSTTDLLRLSTCEYFDVVLAFNFLHWFKDWRFTLEALLALGNEVFIQIPNNDETNAPNIDLVPEMHETLTRFSACIGSSSQFPGHPERLIFKTPIGIQKVRTKTCWECRGIANIVITPTYESCTIKIHDKEERQWIPGINLWNFCLLSGIWPLKDKVIEMVELPCRIRSGNHGDITPHNFILDGEHVHLIDGYEGWKFDDESVLLRSIKEVSNALA